MIFRFKDDAESDGISLKLDYPRPNPRSGHPPLGVRRQFNLHLTGIYFFEQATKVVPVLLDFVDRYANSFKKGFQRQLHGKAAYVCDNAPRLQIFWLSGDRFLSHLRKFAGE